MSSKLNSLQDLYVEELKDIYNAEQQLVKALPKMAKKASSGELQNAFQEHLEQTKGHVQRIERIFASLGLPNKGKTCDGMKGLVDEGSEILDADGSDTVRDAAIIAAAQRVEHYEIAAYGSVRTFAEHLSRTDDVELLEQTLQEEKEADQKLTEIAESSINVEAEEG